MLWYEFLREIGLVFILGIFLSLLPVIYLGTIMLLDLAIKESINSKKYSRYLTKWSAILTIFVSANIIINDIKILLAPDIIMITKFLQNRRT